MTATPTPTTRTLRRELACVDHDVMVRAILATFERATAAELAAGADWYPCAGRLVAELAAWADVDPDTFAAALAALSPRNPWAWNVLDAAAFAYAARSGQDRPSATTFHTNAETAWTILNGGRSWTGAALKVRAFVRALRGDHDAVVVDVWAVRVATRGELSAVGSLYHKVAAAYLAAADTLGLRPADVQAITWLVGQREGLGSARRGRHDETLKRATDEAHAVARPHVARLLGK